jgi:hypothetical protein
VIRRGISLPSGLTASSGAPEGTGQRQAGAPDPPEGDPPFGPGRAVCRRPLRGPGPVGGLRLFLSPRGQPLDDAQVESLFRTPRMEQVYLSENADLDDAYQQTTELIEGVYNRKRPNSALGSRPPVEFEGPLHEGRSQWGTPVAERSLAPALTCYPDTKRASTQCRPVNTRPVVPLTPASRPAI